MVCFPKHWIPKMGFGSNSKVGPLHRSTELHAFLGHITIECWPIPGDQIYLLQLVLNGDLCISQNGRCSKIFPPVLFGNTFEHRHFEQYTFPGWVNDTRRTPREFTFLTVIPAEESLARFLFGSVLRRRGIQGLSSMGVDDENFEIIIGQLQLTVDQFVTGIQT